MFIDFINIYIFNRNKSIMVIIIFNTWLQWFMLSKHPSTSLLRF